LGTPSFTIILVGVKIIIQKEPPFFLNGGNDFQGKGFLLMFFGVVVTKIFVVVLAPLAKMIHFDYFLSNGLKPPTSLFWVIQI